MKEMYVLMMVLLVVAAMSGCVDEGVETNVVMEENVTNVTDAVEEIEVVETTEVVEVSGNITFGVEMNLTNGTTVDGEYVEGSTGYSVMYLVDPPEVTYFGDPNAVDTTLRRSLQSAIRFGDMSEEEAQYIFEQCGGHGSVLEKVQLPEVELTDLVEIDPQPSDEEAYTILAVLIEARALNEEEQAMYAAYKVQFSGAHMEEWSGAHMDFMMGVAFSIAGGDVPTFIDNTWYMGKTVT
ncbi:MAG: hypothetical protein C5S52_03330 [ANME-2 cluster archaeon]|nr:hypothetical protein [ANME-2 cluster archaeon]